MAQIMEAYEFMKSLFETHAEEVLRKNYICPAGETPALPTVSKKAGWIHHPAPRNVFHIPVENIVA